MTPPPPRTRPTGTCRASIRSRPAPPCCRGTAGSSPLYGAPCRGNSGHRGRGSPAAAIVRGCRPRRRSPSGGRQPRRWLAGGSAAAARPWVGIMPRAAAEHRLAQIETECPTWGLSGTDRPTDRAPSTTASRARRCSSNSRPGVRSAPPAATTTRSTATPPTNTGADVPQVAEPAPPKPAVAAVPQRRRCRSNSAGTSETSDSSG